MAFIYMAIGAVALGSGAFAIWALFFALDLMIQSLGVGVVQYLLPMPIVALCCYLLGGAIYEIRYPRPRVKSQTTSTNFGM